MPRYFFHVRDGTGVAQDEDGRELANVELARSEALKGVRSIISDEVKRGLIDLRGEVTVTNRAGAVLLRVRFEEAVELRLEGEA